MNKRLSGLQHWILTTAYKSEYKSVTKYEIYRDFYHIPCHTGKGGFHVKAFFDDPKASKVKTVCLSRSLKRLFRMGLILDPYRFFEIQLSPDGILIAKELLSLKARQRGFP